MAERASLIKIYSLYKNRIYWLAVGITRNLADAEDVLQNTFLKVANNIKNFRGEAKLSTWIYKIAYNEALMYLRTKSRQTRLSKKAKSSPLNLLVSRPRLPDEQLIDSEFKQRLDSAVKTMPLNYRAAFILHRLEGLSIKDAASILKIKENSLKTRVHRAYAIIRSQMAAYYKDQEIEEVKESAECGIFMKFLHDYSRGKLKPKRRKAFNCHIQGCGPCHSFLKTYEQLIHITEAIQCQDLPPQLQAKLKSFLQSYR